MSSPFTLRIKTRGLDGLAQRLAARHLEPAANAAATRAARALQTDLEAASGAAVETSGGGARRRLSVRDAAALARERGTLSTPPVPWLAATLLAFKRGRRP